MALTPEELQQWVEDKVKSGRKATWSLQNDVSYYRGLYPKFDYQLLDLEVLYENKLSRLIQMYKEGLDEFQNEITNFKVSKIEFKGNLHYLKEKALRLAEKWWAVKYEIEGRSKGFFIREPVGTSYYIDLDGGNDGNTGLSIAQAWLTIEKYTTVTGRTAGDIAYVRAGTSQTKNNADINMDEDGNEDNFIQIIGCDSEVNDPWSDASDVKPILSFGDANYRMFFSADDWWKLTRMVVKESNLGAGNIQASLCDSLHFIDCEFTDNNVAGKYGMQLYAISRAYLKNCIFKDNLGTGLFLYRGTSAKLAGCIFDGGVLTTDYGLQVYAAAICEIVDSSFGLTTSHDTSDLKVLHGGVVKARNTEFDNPTFGMDWNCVVSEEDVNKVYGAHKTTYFQGKATKDTGIVRSGGASSSAKLEPNGYCGINNPLTLHAKSIIDSTFKVWCTAVETTITIYIRSLGVWAGYPTNSQLYCEASYLDHVSNATRSTQKSTAVLSDETTWVAFTMTFTPLQAGWVYVNVFLNKYEASKGCYVDIKPLVS